MWLHSIFIYNLFCSSFQEKALMEARLNKEILEVQERCIQLENKV